MTAGEERKKRVAERQITKDDRDDDNDGNKEAEPSLGFPKADEETLKQRRIVKVRRVEKTEQKTSSNPFAKISTGSVFGSGYSSSFGAAANTGTGFGFGFGNAGTTSSTASVFGTSTAFSGGGLTSTASSESAFGTTLSSNASKSEQQVASFPEEVELKTGEEDEDVIFTIRAKSHILADAEEIKREEVKDHSAPSVPPSSSNTPSMDAKDAKEENGNTETAVEGSKPADADQAEPSEPKQSQGESKEKKEDISSGTKDAQTSGEKSKAVDDKKKRQEWREVGIGPLRILKKNKCHTRVVQRRESAPGGAGTKLLINVKLFKESAVGRLSDQHIRFTTIEPSGTTATYLLKVKTKSEADQLQQVLEAETAQSASFDGGNN